MSAAASALVRIEDEVERRPLHELLAELKYQEVNTRRSRAKLWEEGEEADAKKDAARRAQEDQKSHVEWMGGFIRNHWLLFFGVCVVSVVTVAT